MTDPGNGGRRDEESPSRTEGGDVTAAGGGPTDTGTSGDGEHGPATATDGNDGTTPPSTGADSEDGYLQWLLTTDEPSIVVLRDVVSSVGTVVLIGALLFAISGLWPPLVAVESGSMEPHMHRGDLVFVMEEDRLEPGQGVGGTGVVTYEAAREVDRENEDQRGYRSFGEYGNVVVYERDGRATSPIIHRAHLYVEEDERWVSRANEDYLSEDATCDTVSSCPAPYDGFVTKGDANSGYDQADNQRISGVVKPEWVRGRAKARVPYLGHVRLLLGTVGGGPSPVVGSPGAVVPFSVRLLAVCGIGAAAAYGTRT